MCQVRADDRADQGKQQQLATKTILRAAKKDLNKTVSNSLQGAVAKASKPRLSKENMKAKLKYQLGEKGSALDTKRTSSSGDLEEMSWLVGCMGSFGTGSLFSIDDGSRQMNCEIRWNVVWDNLKKDAIKGRGRAVILLLSLDLDQNVTLSQTTNQRSNLQMTHRLVPKYVPRRSQLWRPNNISYANTFLNFPWMIISFLVLFVLFPLFLTLAF